MPTGENAGDWRVEARGLVASAAALIRELAEEGVADFERIAETSATSPTASIGAPASAAVRVGRIESGPVVAPLLAPEVAKIATPSPVSTHPRAGAHHDLDAVRLELGDCRRCGLCEGREKIVFGDGNPNADILFIGEGPGEQEDRTGLPFVGRAGELLTQMIEKGMGLARSEVYICNIVKCRPPGNRNPLPPEVSACRPFLDGQIEAVAPKVIVTLGKPAASLLLDREIAITRMRGSWQEYRGIPLMPTLHPAYVLRQYTPENRRAVWQDLRAALERSRA
mgnify:CR=1 FL=1